MEEDFRSMMEELQESMQKMNLDFQRQQMNLFPGTAPTRPGTGKDGQ
jgi:hypothetical protein